MHVCARNQVTKMMNEHSFAKIYPQLWLRPFFRNRKSPTTTTTMKVTNEKIGLRQKRKGKNISSLRFSLRWNSPIHRNADASRQKGGYRYFFESIISDISVWSAIGWQTKINIEKILYINEKANIWPSSFGLPLTRTLCTMCMCVYVPVCVCACVCAYCMYVLYVIQPKASSLLDIIHQRIGSYFFASCLPLWLVIHTVFLVYLGGWFFSFVSIFDCIGLLK